MIKKILKILAILIIYVVVFCAAFFTVRVVKAKGNVKEATMGILHDVADKITSAEPIFVMGLGISTDLDKELTDTIMVAGYNPKTQKAFLVSIPRDTFVGDNFSKVRAKDKINSLYTDSGVNSTIAAVEELTGVNIDYYATIRMNLLTEGIDAVGGIEFDVPIDMYYNDPTQNLHINLKKGKQILNGDKAEQLLRFRHNDDGTSYPYEYGDNDFGRMRTQREFLKAAFKQGVEKYDLKTATEMAKKAFDYVETDIELSYALSYFVYAYEFSTDDIIMEQLPGESIKSPNGVWIYKHDEVKTKELFDNILAEFYGTNTENEENIESDNYVEVTNGV